MAKEVSNPREPMPDGRLLHWLFAVSSLLLLAVTLWMVADDHYRPWKKYQRKFRQVQRDATNRELLQAKEAIAAEVKALNERRDEALGLFEEKRKTVEELEETLTLAKSQEEEARFAREVIKAEFDALKYTGEVARHEERRSEAERVDRELAELLKKLEAATERHKVQEMKTRGIRDQLRVSQGNLPEIESELTSATRKIQTIEKRLAKLQDDTVEVLRNLPLLDFADPTLKIRKVVLEDLLDDYNFVRVPKIDRCMTCHVGIDQAVKDPVTRKAVGGRFDTAEQPFTSHPRLDLYLADSSPHPMGQFGCTVCHDGGGNETDFVLAAHTPRDEEQAREWKDKYGWSERHHWDYPMVPPKYIQARCAPCHDKTFAVPEAEKLSHGRALYYEFNCYNCHKTTGFEAFPAYGPRLTFLSDKMQRDEAGEVNPEWVYNWVKAPRNSRPTTRMPHFFFLSNTSGEDDNGVNYPKRNETEIRAIAHYLLNQSQSNDLESSFDFEQLRKLADPEKGKFLAETIGCFGCHQIGEIRPDAKPGADFGPHLANLGDKTTFEWIVSWLKDPQKHWFGTRMPDLRLADEEASAIASYLVTLKEERYKPDPLPPGDPDILDEIVIHYLGAALPRSEAAKKTAAMDRSEKMNYAGERLIRRYGCYSCHLLVGFDDMKPIGTDQSEAGSKPLSRIDFGFVIPHDEQTRHGWIEKKMEDPRIFDQGRIKTPSDKLMMPQFDFNEEQREAIVTFLMSLTTEIVPPRSRKILDDKERAMEAGRELTRQTNCLGCHTIEIDKSSLTEAPPDAGPDAPSEDAEPQVAEASPDAEPDAEPDAGPDASTGEAKPQLVEAPLDIGPNLSIEGVRVRFDWLHNFLQRPSTLRPKIEAHMPTLYLNPGDADTIVRYLALVAGSEHPFPELPELIATREEKLEGESLFELSNCMSCHQVGERKYRDPTKEFYPKVQMDEVVKLAPDFRFARGRLRIDWVKRWISNPQSVLPDTKMPDLKLLDRDIGKIMRFLLTDRLDQSEWFEWVEEQKVKEAERPAEFNEFK